MADLGVSNALIVASVIATTVWLAQSIVGPRIPVTIRRSATIDAPIGRVWRALDPFGLDYVPTGNAVRAERAADDPGDTVRLYSYDPITGDERIDTMERLSGSDAAPRTTPGGGGVRTLAMHVASIENVSRCAREAHPMGKRERQSITAEALPDGRTRVNYEWRAYVRDPLTHAFAGRRATDTVLANVRAFAKADATNAAGVDPIERSSASPASTSTPFRVKGLTFAALFLVVASLVFGPIVGVMVAGLILLHEIGHAVAFRLVGERVLSITLLPFIAGETVGTPPRTAVRDAVVSLGGALISAIVLLCALALIPLLGLEFADADSWRHAGTMSVAGLIALAALLGGILNLFQLFPIPFLDGGQVWLAMLARLRRAWAHGVLAALSALVAAVCFWIGDVLFAGFALALAALTLAPQSRSRPHAFAPPSWGGVATIALMYAGSILLVTAVGVGGVGMRSFLSPPTFKTPAEFALGVERGQACRVAEGPGHCTALWPLTHQDPGAHTPAEWFAAAEIGSRTVGTTALRGALGD